MNTQQIQAAEYVVINDGQFQYPVKKSHLRPEDSEESLKKMSGDEYSIWCHQEVPADFAAAGGDAGSQKCIDFCEALKADGADVWYIG